MIILTYLLVERVLGRPFRPMSITVACISVLCITSLPPSLNLDLVLEALLGFVYLLKVGRASSHPNVI
jgi:hypothetical protein